MSSDSIKAHMIVSDNEWVKGLAEGFEKWVDEEDWITSDEDDDKVVNAADEEDNEELV
ncbi:hypothetical protein PCANC_04787 [Puccinia coronata f. sp. avenae]|uniref:Uncharacterized protein n=1 Tax=Puccinia coronata f. sp. avenae TaxID=200324 RepID=A0A2N5VWS7_9BASI|nr:hypothetical protein PCANC_28387 [Puccinia coronata f. sp. avenae]PLW54431.1 hypothetical protein PCANC_04787 [Puccinia coronata f. sp. avenae]